MGKWTDAIKKLEAEISAQKNIHKSAGVDESQNTTSKKVPDTKTVESHEDKKNDASSVDNKAADENVNHEEKVKPRRLDITPPPNCYVDGKITSNFGVYSYKEIYYYTSQPLIIKKDGGRIMPCTNCYIKQKYDAGKCDRRYKQMVCADCRGYTYIQECNVNAIDLRGSLIKKGLEMLIDNLCLGYDPKKQALIFPLNNFQYVELGFDGREYTQSRKDALKVLMHYNRVLIKDGQGGFKSPYNFGWNEFQYMPYLDNRFFCVDGEIVIAGRAGSIDDKGRLDNGKSYIEQGHMILPFPLP